MSEPKIGTEDYNRQALRKRVESLPPHLLVSAFNIMQLLEADPEYFDEVNTKYFQRYYKNLNVGNYKAK